MRSRAHVRNYLRPKTTGKGNAAAVAELKAKADRHAQDVLPIVDAQRTGHPDGPEGPMAPDDRAEFAGTLWLAAVRACTEQNEKNRFLRNPSPSHSMSGWSDRRSR